MCAFADALTARPPRIGADDVAALRKVGCDDDAINDVVQVVAYFNYINRVAEGLGVEPEAALEHRADDPSSDSKD